MLLLFFILFFISSWLYLERYVFREMSLPQYFSLSSTAAQSWASPPPPSPPATYHHNNNKKYEINVFFLPLLLRQIFFFSRKRCQQSNQKQKNKKPSLLFFDELNSWHKNQNRGSKSGVAGSNLAQHKICNSGSLFEFVIRLGEHYSHRRNRQLYFYRLTQDVTRYLEFRNFIISDRNRKSKTTSSFRRYMISVLYTIGPVWTQ